MKVNTFFEFQFFVVNKQCCYQIIVYLLQTFGKKSRDILPPPTLTLRGGSMSPFLQRLSILLLLMPLSSLIALNFS